MGYLYLLIYEDGSLAVTGCITSDMQLAVANGILDIVRENGGQFEQLSEDETWEVVQPGSFQGF